MDIELALTRHSNQFADGMGMTEALPDRVAKTWGRCVDHDTLSESALGMVSIWRGDRQSEGVGMSRHDADVERSSGREGPADVLDGCAVAVEMNDLSCRWDRMGGDVRKDNFAL